MRDVRLRHEEVVRADLGNITSTFGAAMQRRELAKRVTFSRAKQAWLAFVFQVLRGLARRNKRKEN